MGRLVHFEIHVDDMDRAKRFYGEIFGWTFEDWSEYAGMPYLGVITGSDDQLGINGALMQRQGPPPTRKRLCLYDGGRGLRYDRSKDP